MNFFLLPALLWTALAATNASAQLMLPGALQAAPERAPASPSAPGAEPAKPKPIAEKPPGEDAIVDRNLLRDGSQGLIAFQRTAGKGLEIRTLAMSGEQMSHPGEACRIDVVAGSPIEAQPMGKPEGLLRYRLDIEACPFWLDVLDGAILVSRAAKTCDFAAADCRVDPTGLWGPAGSTIGDKQIKEFERARGQAEATMRANFRALLASVSKDKDAVKKFAGEQAGFSSVREVTCRNYAGEDAHGFCALRLTQGRAFALQAELADSRRSAQASKPRLPSAELSNQPKPETQRP